jgi:hypothetical protein
VVRYLGGGASSGYPGLLCLGWPARGEQGPGRIRIRSDWRRRRQGTRRAARRFGRRSSAQRLGRRDYRAVADAGQKESLRDGGSVGLGPAARCIASTLPV